MRFSHISIQDGVNSNFTITTTVYRPNQQDDFRATLADTSSDVSFFTFFDPANSYNSSLSWLQAIPTNLKKYAVSIPPHIETTLQTNAKDPIQPDKLKKLAKPSDKIGAVTALFRTAQSSFFWIILSDFSKLQSLSMLFFQSFIHYCFTYKGYKLDILNLSKDLSVHAATKLGFEKAGESKSYTTSIKYLSNFSLTFLQGMGYMGIIAWEDIILEFTHREVYQKIAFYSILALFATGSWNNFLSDQQRAPKPLLSNQTIKNIYRFNGLVMSIAFPLMLNGNNTGTILIGTTGITGLLMMQRGEAILSWLHLQRLAWELKKCAGKTSLPTTNL